MRPITMLAAAALLCLSGATQAQAAKKKPAKTYIYGLCGGKDPKDLCKVNAATRKGKRIGRHKGKKEYDGVSVSASGRTMALDYGGDMLRTARDGRRRTKLDGYGSRPFVSPDGRSVGWIQPYQYPSCTSFPYFSCIYLTNYAAAVQRLGETKSDRKGGGVITAGWYRNQLLISEEPDDAANEDADFICIADDDGDCTQTVASDPTRALSSPMVSPNGRYLAVVSEPKPLPNADQRFKGRIEIWNPANARRIRVLNRGTGDDTPMFSPDSKRVAFQRGEDVLSMSVRGGKAKLVKRKLRVTGPSWSK